MIDCAFLIFHYFNHCIKEPVPFLSGWFCSLNSIHALKKKCTTISIESKIRVRFIKPVHIIGWWADTDSFINGNICILGCITDIQSPGSESMQSRDINSDYDRVRMYHWIVGLIKINTFNTKSPIFTVVCNKFPFTITLSLLNNWINNLAEDLCSVSEGFNWYGSWKKADIFGIGFFSVRLTSISETTGLTWSNLKQISSRYVLW